MWRRLVWWLPHFTCRVEERGAILVPNVCKKAVPLQAWSGPEGSRKLRFPVYMTTAQDGGKVVSLTHRPLLPPRKCSWYSFLLEAESTPWPECDRKDFMSMKNCNDTSWGRTKETPRRHFRTWLLLPRDSQILYEAVNITPKHVSKDWQKWTHIGLRKLTK